MSSSYPQKKNHADVTSAFDGFINRHTTNTFSIKLCSVGLAAEFILQPLKTDFLPDLIFICVIKKTLDPIWVGVRWVITSNV